MQMRARGSATHLRHTRHTRSYLAESGCVGMCVNLCKAPVQTFFTEQLGMPLTMSPNFEDLSCEMARACSVCDSTHAWWWEEGRACDPRARNPRRISQIFGAAPPALEDDDALRAPCLTACATATPGAGTCPKLQ